MLPQIWLKSGTYISYRKHQIFTQSSGTGPVLLLLHGFPTSSWDWSLIWDQLATHYRLIAFDFLGFGYSDKPKQFPYSIQEQANISEQVLEHYQVDKYSILAHDYGDSVAQELLARSLESSQMSLQALCFLNGGLFPETHKPLLVQKLLMSPLGVLVGRFLNQQQLERNFQRIFGPNSQPSPTQIQHFWEQIAFNDGVAVAHLLIRYMRERKHYRSRWVGALQQALIPIRLIDGLKDPISGAHLVDRYRELVPNPDVISLTHIGHYPQLEAPEEVIRHVLEFFSGKKA